VRAEDAQETPTQSRLSPSILVHEQTAVVNQGSRKPKRVVDPKAVMGWEISAVASA
jgi:hypothetical protein